ncbi:MAG: Mov34/MPN/PAD-1 family protein [bacterium]
MDLKEKEENWLQRRLEQWEHKIGSIQPSIPRQSQVSSQSAMSPPPEKEKELGKEKENQNVTNLRIKGIRNSKETEISGETIPWQVSNSPVEIFCVKRVYKKIFFQSQEKIPNETGGILLGYVPPPVKKMGRETYMVHIEEAIPMKYDNARYDHFVFTPQEKNRVKNLQQEKYSHLKQVGWYHSHPSHDISLSPPDRELAKTNFMQPWHVALVIQPKKKTAGYFIWENDRLDSECRAEFYLDDYSPCMDNYSTRRVNNIPTKGQNRQSNEKTEPQYRPKKPNPIKKIWGELIESLEEITFQDVMEIILWCGMIVMAVIFIYLIFLMFQPVEIPSERPVEFPQEKKDNLSNPVSNDIFDILRPELSKDGLVVKWELKGVDEKEIKDGILKRTSSNEHDKSLTLSHQEIINGQYKDTDVLPGKDYKYTLTLKLQNDKSYTKEFSSPIPQEPIPPKLEAPTGFNAELEKDGKIVILKWNDNLDSSVKYYEIQVKVGEEDFKKLKDIYSWNSKEYSDEWSPKQKKNLMYKIRTIGCNDEKGEWSKVVKVTIQEERKKGQQNNWNTNTRKREKEDKKKGPTVKKDEGSPQQPLQPSVKKEEMSNPSDVNKEDQSLQNVDSGEEGVRRNEGLKEENK